MDVGQLAVAAHQGQGFVFRAFHIFVVLSGFGQPVLAAGMGRKTRLVRDFQFVKDGLAVDLIGIIAVGGGKVAGGQGSHIIAPVGDAGGAFRGPACEPGFSRQAA